MGVLDTDKAGIRQFFKGFVDMHQGIKFQTSGVSGRHEFVTHEMTIQFQAGVGMESFDIKKGDFVKMVGVSLQTWREEVDSSSATWKITEAREYFFFART